MMLCKRCARSSEVINRTVRVTRVQVGSLQLLRRFYRHLPYDRWVDRLRRCVEMFAEKSVNVLKHLQCGGGPWRSRPAAIEGEAVWLAGICAHFHGLARGLQVGYQHFGVETIEPGRRIPLHNEDRRSNPCDFLARQLLILRRIGAWIIGHARTIPRRVPWSLLRNVPIVEAGEQQTGRLLRRDGRDVSRSGNLQREVPSALHPKTTTLFGSTYGSRRT